MKKLVIALVSLFFVAQANSQIKDPVSFTYKANKRAPGVYEVIITADVPKPWHMYSQSTPKGGPIPTKVIFAKNPLIVPEGKLKETGNLEKINDKVFGVKVFYYSGKVVYSQVFRVKGAVSTNLSGSVNYMVCDDTQCLPPTKKTFDLKLQ
ncbi:MAG: protein-disulfide reductase DsbD family protein [Sediminibacterium sp.]|nr:protein-disulfide reductase DsbD family protein [Sediminibacterium sp.]